MRGFRASALPFRSGILGEPEVVSFNVGGVREIIHPGRTGFLVDAGDEDELCAVVGHLAQNPELRFDIGRRGRAYVEANHSLERLPPMLSDLYARAFTRSRIHPARGAMPRHAH